MACSPHLKDYKYYEILVGKSEGNVCEGGRIMLERILRKQSGKLWTRFICLRTGSNGGLLRVR
jgi:hypothetical protein